MPGNAILSALTSRIRARADIRNSTVWTDAEIAEEAEQSHGEMFDILLETAGPDWFVTRTPDLATVAGTDTYVISSNAGEVVAAPVYRVVGVDVKFQGVWRKIDAYPFWDETRENGRNESWAGPAGVRYRTFVTSDEGPLVDDAARYIRFSPAPAGVFAWRVRYVPSPADWSSLSSSYAILGLSGWDEFVVADVVAKICESLGWHAKAALERGRAQNAADRIRRAAQQADLDRAERIRDRASENTRNRDLEIWERR